MNLEIEENMHSYLLYLLMTGEDEFEAQNKKKKTWQVLGVILVTMGIQIYALTIMLFDIDTYYITDNT